MPWPEAEQLLSSQVHEFRPGAFVTFFTRGNVNYIKVRWRAARTASVGFGLIHCEF